MLQRRSGLLAALSLGAALMSLTPGTRAAPVEEDPCARPAPGSAVTEPKDLRSEHGVLKLDLRVRNHREADGSVRYCYRLADGTESPTLRLHPGDWLILHLKNELEELDKSAQQPQGHAQSHDAHSAHGAKSSDPCSSGAMSAVSTNLHFHGLTVPAVCHQDDVLKTSIQPGDPPFEYRFQIPAGEPPGLYWYHPHIHGFSSPEVQGGASGALIIEGIERATPIWPAFPSASS
jgi:FtsP/CotA-like multicopper oxidase with cupredoxin domain